MPSGRHEERGKRIFHAEWMVGIGGIIVRDRMLWWIVWPEKFSCSRFRDDSVGRNEIHSGLRSGRKTWTAGFASRRAGRHHAGLESLLFHAVVYQNVGVPVARRSVTACHSQIEFALLDFDAFAFGVTCLREAFGGQSVHIGDSGYLGAWYDDSAVVVEHGDIGLRLIGTGIIRILDGISFVEIDVVAVDFVSLMRIGVDVVLLVCT